MLGRSRSDDFDHEAFFVAMDGRRQQQGLSWTGLATAIWEQSRVLNEQRGDHPISPGTLSGMRRRASCQHVLFVLRWLGRAPEDFLPDPREETVGVPLPEADDAHRLRWNLRRLYAVLDAGRGALGLTWAESARRLGCTSSQLTGLKAAKFATGMTLAMRITQATRRPAAEFVDVACW
ncbi:hypothetical protein GCM10011575_25270 [Microlunatus endophyticus]|uniref:Uncharacterized protein n=1 Tax=Microlunatus endophyticus TaxID=1716077 RepID=A0A917S9R2_9ACTN|nr:hypothetical protein [Microlunatus endophyticus]GGL65810.1 hypothetical protein GCM10011575_25270 [Microlunatus endophyticus]